MMEKFDVEPIPAGARECLDQLFMRGPTMAGTIVSKSGRSWLLNKGYAEGEDGWYWLTTEGTTLALEIGLGRIKERCR
jgi:hypothetical protein